MKAGRIARRPSGVRGTRRWRVRPLWARVWSRLRAFVFGGYGRAGRPRRLLLPRPRLERRFGAGVAALEPDVRGELSSLGAASRALDDALGRGIEGYAELREVLLSSDVPGSPVDDAAVLAAADVALRALVSRASALEGVVAIAGRRAGDRASREAVGAEMLDLRDRARAICDTASAAMRWVATARREDAEHLRAAAERMRGTTE